MQRSGRDIARTCALLVCIGAFYSYALLPTSTSRRLLASIQSSLDTQSFFIAAQVGLFGAALALFCATAFSRGRFTLERVPCAPGLAAGVLSLAAFLYPATASIPGAGAVLGVVFGIGQLPLHWSWCLVLSEVDAARRLALLAGGIPVSELFSWAALASPSPAGAWSLLAVAVVATAPMAVRLVRRKPAGASPASEENGGLSLREAVSTGKMVVCGPPLGLALFVLIASTIGTAIGDVGPATVALTALGAALLVGATSLGRHRNVPYALTQVVLPLVAAALLLIRLLPESAGTDLLYQYGNVVFLAVAEALSVFYVAQCMGTAQAGRFLVVCAYITLLSLASLVGIALAPLPGESRDAAVDTATVLFLLYIVGEFAVRAFRRQGQQANAVGPEAYAEFGRARGLSARETDVLALLGRGYNAGYIASKLFISVNTVRNHVRHIYAKLDVGSHDELLELLDRELAAQRDAVSPS